MWWLGLTRPSGTRCWNTCTVRTASCGGTRCTGSRPGRAGDSKGNKSMLGSPCVSGTGLGFRQAACVLQAKAKQKKSKKIRYGSSMPFAVDCTADLVRCKILDLTHGVGSDELVLLYGLALVRFVNLITERKQKTVAIPLRRLANEMKIPEWIVNLRHEITHGKLPKLSWCRKGCEFVLEWLRREYWSRQLGNRLVEQWDSDLEEEESTEDEEGAEKDPKSPEFYENVQEVLMSYVEEQFQVLEEMQKTSKAKRVWNSPSPELKSIIARVKDFAKEDSETVAETLLDNGFLIPTVEQLMSLKIKFEESSNLLNLKVPRVLLQFWQPLLKSLHSRAFTQMLLEKLFNDLRGCYESVTKIRPQYLLYWIYEILSANHRAGKKIKGLFQILREKKRWKLFLQQVPLQWNRLLDQCLATPCLATPHLMQIILLHMEPKLPLNVQKNLLQLCSIYTQGGECLSDLECSAEYREQPIYTVESLRWKARQDSRAKGSGKREVSVAQDDESSLLTEQTCQEDHLQMLFSEIIDVRKSALEGSAWTISADDVKWSEFPLGTVPGQSEDPGCLLLDSYYVMSVLDQSVANERKHPPVITASASELNCSASGGLLWTQSDIHHIKAGLQFF